MSCQMSSGGVLFINRLLRSACASARASAQYPPTRRETRAVVVEHPKQRICWWWCVRRTFSGGGHHHQKAGNNGSTGGGDEGDGSSEEPSSSLNLLDRDRTPRRGLLLAGGRRPLSPLERISRLLPPDSLSPDVAQLREQSQGDVEVNEQEEGPNLDDSIHDSHDGESIHIQEDPGLKDDISSVCGALWGPAVKSSDSETPQDHALTYEQGHGSVPPSTLPGERRLAFGELLVAEYTKRREEYKNMFTLKPGGRLQSNWGCVFHNDMAGQPPGLFLKTTQGQNAFIRRASLEDYVLYMRRGPTISYPKDANAMLLMMDITEGDCVLESGSGSGAMTLFLSRAVGSKGSVLSVEIRQDHHKRAVLNYNRWCDSWRMRRGEEWPDNVQFCNADLMKASSLLAGRGFHSIALDMISPQLVLPTVLPHLHPGAVCAVYLANITQVIDLLDGIRCSALPLLCERIIEVPYRDWLVAPARHKDGSFCVSKPIADAANGNSDEEKEALTTKEHPPFGSVPYIARPHHVQMSHTAFLIKLRKCVR